MSLPNDHPRPSAYYAAPIAGFLAEPEPSVLGHLAGASGLSIDGAQTEAWKEQIRILKQSLGGVEGSLFLEFDVPRLGSRIDGVVVARSAIVPIEFKVDAKHYTRPDYNQAWDYALDLKNFHEASRETPIFPVLCATSAPAPDSTTWQAPHADGVYPPLKVNAATVGEALHSALQLAPSGDIDSDAWARSPYRPSPTIVEAAKALYARHSVQAIARSDAGARNLHATSACVDEIIARSRANREKTIVFVTGVPGAGKTLVGLNVATQHLGDDDTHAVFLSGNGPLVSVLREALVEDDLKRQAEMGVVPERKGVVRQKVKPFIQNVHHFRDDALRDATRPPAEHVAIFDEAQRAWNRDKTALFMKQRKGVRDFDMSEPEFLLSYMDRHRDWAVVVCLVGGGQEIHTGESGIGAWLDAVRERFAHWHTYISPELHDSEYAAGQAISRLGTRAHVETQYALHLAVSMRSFRAEQVSGLVKAVLDTDEDRAREILGNVLRRYPIALTRDRTVGKQWVRKQARGNERLGLLASSQAQRLKAYCIDVRVNVDPVKYFLAPANDTRSSYYLEDAATEFQTQGLELDWTMVSWDADLRRHNGAWSYHNFRGDRWTTVRNADRQRYLLNAYRVLLTRARQGMAIFVPKGRKSDSTLQPTNYDETYCYLAGLGIPAL